MEVFSQNEGMERAAVGRRAHGTPDPKVGSRVPRAALQHGELDRVGSHRRQRPGRRPLGNAARSQNTRARSQRRRGHPPSSGQGPHALRTRQTHI